ncbi:MAG: hypothetical protein GX446_13550 [Chthonomonadales bacterium]|nr:hypothetical protein [Chthonomonadales bacterium]
MSAPVAVADTATNDGTETQRTPMETEPTRDHQKQNTAPSSANEAGGRRMPDHIRKHLITMRDGQHYLPSAFRVLWFRQDHPDWSIITELIEGGFQAGWATVRASILSDEGRVIATGLKSESKADFPAGWVEKAETGAVGRALAMAGYGTQFAPELYDGEASPRAAAPRAAQARAHAQATRKPPQPSHAVWQGPGLCPSCHAPQGKPHSRTCSDPK